MRGDIYRLPGNQSQVKHAQKGARYAVIVQSDELMLSTVLVAPTSTSVRPTSFRPRINMNGTTTYVLTEQTVV
ncbi:MAG: type II toxin-antitoxin system PemK/MazF family toxin, partial [Promicromonosporaceae bacterium]|nr:type II toxin-antitoxin system PemK/MazF family toxin [Promicromonosporaceae bacterium]